MDEARKLQEEQVPQVDIFLTGTVPESITAPVRRFSTDHILLLDAADMDARPAR